MKQTSLLLLGICVALACVSLGLTGYIFLGGDNGAAPTRVAVVDLDTIAKRLGRIDVMNQKLREQGADYDQQLKKIQINLQSQVTAKENELKSFGPQVTNEQKKELIGMVRVANDQFNLAKREALGKIEQQKAVMIQKFRDETIAVAKKIAKEQGFDMVVAKNPSVLLSFDPSFDITESVIEAMPAMEPAPETSTEEVVATQAQPVPTPQVAQTQERPYR